MICQPVLSYSYIRRCNFLKTWCMEFLAQSTHSGNNFGVNEQLQLLLTTALQCGRHAVSKTVS